MCTQKHIFIFMNYDDDDDDAKGNEAKPRSELG